LHFRHRHLHGGFFRELRVADTRQHVGDRISHAHESPLPAGLDHAGDFAPHRDLAQFVAAEAELAVDAARAAGQLAAVAQPGRAGVARQLLQLVPRIETHVLGQLEVVDDRNKLGALFGVLLHHLAALQIAVDDSRFSHGVLGLQFLNGNLNAASSAFASASVFAVVAIVIFMPRSASILSYSISGKMICSLTPMLKLPRPSNERPDTPRKSRTRGSAIDTRRSRNSYIRCWRKVTMQPIG